MVVVTKNLTVMNVPEDVLDFLRPYAARDGRGTADAAVLRFSAIELAKRLRAEQNPNTTAPASEALEPEALNSS